MKFSISNIAWDEEEDSSIKKILIDHCIDGVEIAPSKIWKNPIKAKNNDLIEYKKFWCKDGLNIISLQALLFGRPDLLIFKNNKRRETLDYLKKVIKIGSKLGAKILVFGAPKNRKIHELDTSKANQIAADFFYNLSKFAYEHSLIFCIEPNPIVYDCDFITNTKQGIDLVNEVNHPGFGLHLDSAGMTLSGEDIQDSLKKAIPYLKHFHISSPYLSEIDKISVNHNLFSKILKKNNYQNYLSVEMKAGLGKSNLDTVKNNLKLVKTIYS